MAQSYPIDFVVLWVDGADPAWREKRALWAAQMRGAQKTDADNGHAENRFRDWDLMRYWFRGAERFAPWVNRIWFVTDGQRPAWLNTDHPRLRVISHAEYLPQDCLPTFNSNAIELGLHRIEGLSEHFVLFNDDMFLCAPTAPEDFFRDGVPCDAALLDAVTAPDPGDCLPHMLINNFAVINRQFSKRQVLRENFGKFFSPQYGADLLRNVLLAPFAMFSAFRDTHLPSSHTKSNFARVWDAAEVQLTETLHHRFRSKEDCTHWMMKAWQICEGNFAVRGTGWGRHFELWEDSVDDICAAVARGTYRAVCINDSKPDIDFAAVRARLQDAFETLLPQMSAYEKQL